MRFKEWDKEANYGVGAEKFSAGVECASRNASACGGKYD
jgi:hypothetical protein